MFELRLFENGATGMTARCDVCGEQVKADYANVLWDGPMNDEYCAEYRIACKGACTWAADPSREQWSVGLGTACVAWSVTT